MKNFNNRYLCKNIHRYFTDIFDISDISVKSNYRYIRVYRYFDPWLRVTTDVSVGSIHKEIILLVLLTILINICGGKGSHIVKCLALKMM